MITVMILGCRWLLYWCTSEGRGWELGDVEGVGGERQDWSLDDR